MEKDYREKERKSYNMMRTIYNITMGAIIMAIGVLMLLNQRIGFNFSENIDPVMVYAFGGLCLLYGAFRLYRGIKRNY